MIERLILRRAQPAVPMAGGMTPIQRLDPSALIPDTGPRVWCKRDDLTWLGGGGNKARKLDFLVGAALDQGADTLITSGATQSNHCRMTAAAGARAGLDVHLVLAGDQPDTWTGNQVLSTLFGAQLHFTGADDAHWGELEIASDALVQQLSADGSTVYSVPVGGSTPTGALGYVEAFFEMMEQCHQIGFEPSAIVHTSSSGGTHAGLVAGRAAWRAVGRPVPDIVAIGVAAGVNAGMPDIAELASATLGLTGLDGEIVADDVEIDPNYIGDGYAVPTQDGDAAIVAAAHHAGLVLDRVYTGKGFAGLLGQIDSGRWESDSDVIFIHTGGMPSVFATDGVPAS